MKIDLEKITINIFMYCIIILFPEVFFAVNYGGFYAQIVPFVFSVIIVFLINMSIFLISGSYYKTVKIAMWITLVYLTISHIKLNVSGEAFILSDIVLFTNSFGVAKLSGDVLSDVNTYLGIIPFFLICLAMTAVLHENSTNNIRLRRLGNSKKRVAILTITIVLLILLCVPIKIKDEFILNNVYQVGRREDYAAVTTNYGYSRVYGVISGLYENLLESRIYPPEDYDRREISKALSEANGNENIRFYKKPNIILIFSESFWDINQIDEIKFSKNPLENFDKLKDEGKLINLVSPSYGGLSANVEFELLTGGNMAFFSKGSVPFVSAYDKESTYKPSIIKELKNNGYYSHVVFGKDYFNSGAVYEQIGADKYEDVDDPRHYKGYYVSDEHLVDLAIKAIEKTSTPLFYMTATIQSHMPFDDGKYDKYDIAIESSEIDERRSKLLLSYAQGIYDADKQLGRLYDYIKKSDEETMIIFLGDHLPYISLNNEDILQPLKFFNTPDEMNNIFRKYNTQALILTNYDVGDNKNIETMSPDYLLTYVINNMDIDISDYFKWLGAYKQKLPALNQTIYVDSNNKILLNAGMTSEAKEKYDIRKNMQYFNFFDKEYQADKS